MMFAKYRTFTLLEMLIVIVIIGILAAALIPRLRDMQGRTRNTTRKTHMDVIYKGLMIYYNDYGYLKNTLTYSGGADAGNRDFSSQGTGYDGLANSSFLDFLQVAGIVTDVPVDPINNMTGNGSPVGTYAYRYFCFGSGVGIRLGYREESPYFNNRFIMGEKPFDRCG